MYKFEEYLKNHRVLILDGSKRMAKYPNVTLDRIYRPLKSKWDRDWRKVYEHVSFLKNRKQWYGEWSKNAEGYDMGIFINGIRGRDVIEYFREKNPHARIIMYYETPVEKRNKPKDYQGLGVEFVSFDRDNCEEWGMKYSHFYYDYYDGTIEDIREEQKDFEVVNDIYFCGYDKHRLEYLLELQNRFNELGLSNEMVVVRTPHKRYAKKFEKYLSPGRFPYRVLAEGIYKSKAILDIVEPGQRGITLRPMESIFFRKKLITNNSDVVNYDFYRKNNIFIIGQQPLEEIREFLDVPYEDVPIEIVQNYTVEAWMERFFLNG